MTCRLRTCRRCVLSIINQQDLAHIHTLVMATCKATEHIANHTELSTQALMKVLCVGYKGIVTARR